MRHLKVLKYLAEGAGSAPFFGHIRASIDCFLRWRFFFIIVEDMGMT